MGSARSTGHLLVRSTVAVSAGLGVLIGLCSYLELCGGLSLAEEHVPAASSGVSVQVVLSAVHLGYSGFHGQDEALRLTNVSTSAVALDGDWKLRDVAGEDTAFPSSAIILESGSSVWCARNAISFTTVFGFSPDLEYGTDADPNVPNMNLNPRFQLPDSGGWVSLVWMKLVDSANGDGGSWPGGSAELTDRRSMERLDPTQADVDANWGTAVGALVGLDAYGNPIKGTPKYTNSLYMLQGTSEGLGVVINEVAWSGTGASPYDEWIELHNTLDQDVDLSGWVLRAEDGSPAIELSGWIPASDFYLLERTDDDSVSNQGADLIYFGALENSGERLYLYQGQLVDRLVYGNIVENLPGWMGPPLQRYQNGDLATDGQVLFRRYDGETALPVPDTDTAMDWANDTFAGDTLYGPVHVGDLRGKRVMYPGWDWNGRSETYRVAASGHVTVGIAPDNMYTVISDLLASSQSNVIVAGYTFESPWITNVLTERIRAGVQVTVLLEGAPAGGLSEQQLWNCAQIAQAGGRVYFLHNDPPAGVHSRYASQHAKFILVDDRWVAVNTENLSNHGLPVDDKANGTAGDRGAVLITDQPEVVQYVRALFERDCDPVHHSDIVLYDAMARYTVPPTYTAVYSTGGGYRYAAPFSRTVPSFSGDTFEVIHSPETSLASQEGLIGLVLRAGQGDDVYVEQMYERLHWGGQGSDVQSDPNPRLEAYIQAARNGAKVRVLLDSGFDEGGQNLQVALYVREIAQREGLNLQARLGNPTGRGIHSKTVLVRLGPDKFVHIGSINGSETSSKANRELALQVRSAGGYDYLNQVFDYDWAHSGGPFVLSLPLIFDKYVAKAGHVLISEVVFRVAGEAELGEWVEIYNPTEAAADLAGWMLGDATHASDYERLYSFPDGAVLPAGSTLVVARHGEAYLTAGYATKAVPDFEIEDSGPVPDLVLTTWGTGSFALGNGGDEVLLLEPSLAVVDVVVYGSGSHPGTLPFYELGGVINGQSLERWPGNRDSDDCSLDFRVRYEPSPGSVEAW